MKDSAFHLSEKGWVVLDLYSLDPVYKTIELLESLVKQEHPSIASLPYYHHLPWDDATHLQNQANWSKKYHESRCAKEVISSNLDLFTPLIGLNIKIQRSPYLRIARPFHKQDNIGYHRDTFYGGSPYELSVVVPFVDLDEGSTLSVLDGSHILPESDFPTQSTVSESVTKGSQKHQLGFLYAPKEMSAEIAKKVHPVPLKVGQALVFFLSTVHGSIENTATSTRWSSDIRLVNSLAPVDLSARPTYYEPLYETCVTCQAKKYLEQNPGVLC